MDISLNTDFEIIKKSSSTVLCNELSKCVYEGYKKDSKRNYKVTKKMICIFEFLYKVRIATKDQINRYLTLNGYSNVSEDFLKILNMKYGTLSYIDCKSANKTKRVYVPAVGMLYVLDKYTSLEINENTDEYVFQQNINNSFVNKNQKEILKGIILTQLYLDIIQNSVNEVLYLENRVTINQFIKNDINNEKVKFKCDLLVSFKINDKIQSYFVKYIDKDFDIRKYMEIIKAFDIFVKDEELIDRYCILSDKKPKLVFIAQTQELMQDLFNTIINYNIDFNNICLSCLDVIFKDKEYKTFKEEDAFLDIAAYI